MTIHQEMAALRPRMELVSRAIHACPELKFAEFRARDLLTAWLAEENFDVRTPVGGLETAFVATHGRRTPRIAILVEYDALPGVGHGCGHNLIAAGCTAAAIALQRALPDHPGTLTVIGTPGEEMGGAGKIRLAEAGVFDGIDAALMFHPGDRTQTARPGLAAAHLRFAFTGRAAHASISPWQGRSALAAAQLFLHAVDLMRQFVEPTVRIHGVIADGGQAPNVVPAYAAIDLYVRDRTATAVGGLVQRLRDAADGAALATGTAAEMSETGPMYAERRNNAVLGERFAAAMRTLGADIEDGDPDGPAGSSDIGNISLLMPVLHPYIQIAPVGTPAHSDAMREAATTDFAHDRTQLAATALAQVAADLLTKPDA